MRTILTIFLITVIAAAIIINIPLFPVLAIEREDSRHLIAYGKNMDAFDIHYIHSIHKTPVLETYQIKDNHIVQQQITYDEFAVGMPSNDDGEGKFIQQDGHYMITEMNRIFPYLDIRVAQVMPEHGLIIEDKLLPFSTIVKAGSWIRIKHTNISLWQMMKGVDLLERAKTDGTRNYR